MEYKKGKESKKPKILGPFAFFALFALFALFVFHLTFCSET